MYVTFSKLELSAKYIEIHHNIQRYITIVGCQWFMRAIIIEKVYHLIS